MNIREEESKTLTTQWRDKRKSQYTLQWRRNRRRDVICDKIMVRINVCWKKGKKS